MSGKNYRHMNLKVARIMRELYFVGKLKQCQIAKMFGVKPNSVSRVISEQVWPEVERRAR